MARSPVSLQWTVNTPSITQTVSSCKKLQSLVRSSLLISVIIQTSTILNCDASLKLQELEIVSCVLRDGRLGLTSKPSGEWVGIATSEAGRLVGAWVAAVCQVPWCHYLASITRQLHAFHIDAVNLLRYLLTAPLCVSNNTAPAAVHKNISALVRLINLYSYSAKVSVKNVQFDISNFPVQASSV